MGRRNGARVVFVEVCGQTGNLTQLKHPVCLMTGKIRDKERVQRLHHGDGDMGQMARSHQIPLTW